MSTERVQEITGRGHEEWFALLDADGAAELTHTEIARRLAEAHGVPGWWAQNITVEYERARGRRAVNQKADGFYVSVSKTLGVPATEVYAAAEALLPAWRLALRKANPPRGLRADADPGRAVLTVDDRGDRTVLTVSHERLPDAAAKEAARALWKERLAALADQLASSR